MLKVDYKALLYRMKKLSIRKEKTTSRVRKPAGALARTSAVSAAD
jgi:hypothetical protein